ncbi:unnamed protein product [Caenorhabditis bovis]|uniref:Moesin/ezrin/radixin homolog 1 n=1 Tax=Caenorhabditis bovis TaxID=2654633 RepID=A0A8S1FD00_9PELO|nr:unnamed protein product [Caenorhabditis bovis]
MTNIPRGVGAPPPPGMNSAKRGRLVCIKVRMLDDTVAVFHLGHKALGQTLIDEVCRHLNLLESDYFGLSFIDGNGNHCWLDREKSILRQITNGSVDAKFYFIVKFYTPNPIDLEEEYTRYLFTLQLKRDLALGELHCSENTAALLSAYLVQSECGDFSPEDYPDATYLSHTRFIPNQTLEFQKKVMDNHKNFIGMTPGESDLAMLEVARRCDFYGVKLHPAKDIDGNEAALSVMHLGMRVFRQLQLDTTFSWARIRKLSFKRKKLLIKLHPDSYQYLKETVEFIFDTRDECKNFWKKCVEHHAFFRCVQAEEPKKEAKFFISKGSSFRYHGRTQKQLIDYVREHHKRREPFTRPLRSAVSTRKTVGYAATYGPISDRTARNGSLYDPQIAQSSNDSYNNAHSSMPHIAHFSSVSSHQVDPTFSGTLDARVGTYCPRAPPLRPRQLKRGERCTSDVETSAERQPRASRNHNCSTVVPVNAKTEPQDLSVSLPNVRSEDLHLACKEIALESKEPPKSVSGDNFLERRPSRDYDNVSEDSYRLSDHERSTRSEVGVGSKQAATTVFNSTFVSRRPGATVVKRVVAQTKSGTDDEDNNLKHASDYASFRHVKEYPFVKTANIVPIEIDGPNVDLSARRSTTTVSTTTKVLTSSGAVLMKPKVISTESTHPRVSPESNTVTYGAVGPLPGKVISKDNIVITPEGVKERKPKPSPPPKPLSQTTTNVVNVDVVKEIRAERASSHPLVHMVEDVPFSRAPLEFEDWKSSSLSRPALISVQSEDNPDVQKCHLFNSDIPYTLTMRNVESTQSLPYSTFKDVPLRQKNYESNSLKRVSKSPEFKRRKSLDLVPRKRLPSPGNFSAQDHTISPTTPDSDVLEYLLRRKSLMNEKSGALKSRKRTDPRRQTQPVRFDLPPSPCSPTAGGSTPFISLLNDDVFDECVSESRSLHEDMDRLDKSTPHTQSITSFISQKSRRDSEESDAMPPPPDEVLKKSVTPPTSGRPIPPPPPPKSLAASVRVAEMKAMGAGRPISYPDVNDSPPFIDDSPKDGSEASQEIRTFHEPIYQTPIKKKDVIVGINSTFSAETICTSEPIIQLSKKKGRTRMSRSTTDTTELTRAESSDSGGVSLAESVWLGSKSHSINGLLKSSPSSGSLGFNKDIESCLDVDNVENYSSPSNSDEYYITRKDFAKTKPELSSIVKEFYWKELVFTRDLLLITETFFEKIKNHIINCRIPKEMFGSLRELVRPHQDLMDALTKAVSEKEEVMASTVASVLLCAVHNLIPMYHSLIQQYPMYIAALDQLGRSKVSFRTEVSMFEQSKECYIPINWILVKILSRMVNWQPVIARIIEVQLSEGGVESETTSFRVALDKLIEFSEKTKTARNSLEEYVSVLQLERDIGLVGVLSNRNRKVLRFGYALRWARRAPCNRIMILCTDRILFGHRGQNLDGNIFTIHAEIKLKGLMVEEGDTYNVMNGDDNVITLHNADSSIVLSAPDRALWIEDITTAIKNAARTKIDLPSLVIEKKDENDIDISKVFMADDVPTTKLTPLQVAWYRKCSFGRKDVNKMATNNMCGYLKRKLRNSTGWQDLWVVLSCHTLFFYRNHKEKEPLAHLSLLNYGIGLPTIDDNVNHENCFKIFYGSHKYFFHAENYYFFERWVDAILQADISPNSLDIVTALALQI